MSIGNSEAHGGHSADDDNDADDGDVVSGDDDNDRDEE
jgi:hypothetical protein